MNDITLALDNKNSIDIICIDFSKAFDSLSHKKLILKLEYYGINGSLLKWICSFLTNRTFCVKVNNTVSLEYPVISSVPQSLVLATRFFILFINDLCSVIKSSTLKMYADDVTIYHKVNNGNDYNNFKADLSAIQTWALKWQVKINIDKCKVLRFGNKNVKKSYNVNNIKIMRSECEKILGVSIDAECSFKQHSFNIVQKARMTACNILRAFKVCDITVMVSLYKTYVRSILEYASVVFSPHCICLINLLENVQRHYTKRLTGLGMLITM